MTGTGHHADFDVPNLDGYDPSDLEEFSRVYSLLASYADHKAKAMTHRVNGDIEAALSFERCCDATYRHLPQWARW